MKTKYKSPTVFTQIQWKLSASYQNIRALFSKDWTKRIFRLSMTSSNPTKEPQQSDGSLSGLLSRWLVPSWPLSALVSPSNPSTIGGKGSDLLINFIIASLALIISGTLGYWVQDREPPVDIKELKILVDPVKIGGVAKMAYWIQRRKTCHVVIEQLLYDKDNVRTELPDEDFIAEVVGNDRFAIGFKVPDTVEPGPMRYRAVRSYYCNPVHFWFSWPVTVVSPEVNFTAIQ